MHYLDEASLKDVRDELNRHRKSGSYESGKWSVSHFNREPKAFAVAPPENVTIRDITLRTFEQVVGAGFNENEYLALGKALGEANIPALQIDVRRDGKGKEPEDLKKLVKLLKGINPDVNLSIATWNRRDLEFAAELGVDMVQFTQTVMPKTIRGFLYGAAWEGAAWKTIKVPETPEEQTQRSLKLIEMAHQIPIKISIGLNQCGYLTEDYIHKVVPQIAEAGVDEIFLADSTHGLGPDGWRYVCSIVRDVAPSCAIAVHAHNDFGLGTASSIAAALGGANTIEVSINGLGGPGVGQAHLADVVASLEVLYGIHTGIRLEQLTPLSRLAADISRLPIPKDRPITGEHAWLMGGLDEQLWEYEIDPLFGVPVNPEIFGNKLLLRGHVGCASGNWSMFFKLQEMGVQVEKDKIPGILAAVKQEIRLRKRSLSDEEILSLVHQRLPV